MTEKPSVCIPDDLLSDLDKIATATGRTRHYVIDRALRTYLMNEGADILASIKGRDQIAAGEYEDIDDVIAEVDRITEND